MELTGQYAEPSDSSLFLRNDRQLAGMGGPVCYRTALDPAPLVVSGTTYGSHTIALITGTVRKRPKAQSPAINK